MMRKLIPALLILCLLCSWALAEDGVFLPEGQEPIRTEDSYVSQNVAIRLTSMRYLETDLFVADIHVRSMDQVQRLYAGGEWWKAAWQLKDLAKQNGAVLAITGDSAQNLKSGWCVGNATLWRTTKNNKRSLGVLYKDGTFEALQPPVDHEHLEQVKDTIWQTFLFGPVLLDENGKAIETFTDAVKPKNPRSVLGYYEPGHYCFVQVDGRGTKSKVEPGKKNGGLTLAELSQVMESLSCTAAYNLDGGQSSMMWFGEELVSTPYKGGRRVGDALAIIDCPVGSFMTE